MTKTHPLLSEWLADRQEDGNNGMINLNYDQSMWVIKEVVKLEGRQAIFEQAVLDIETGKAKNPAKPTMFTPAELPDSLPPAVEMHIGDCERLLVRALLTYRDFAAVCGPEWARNMARRKHGAGAIGVAASDLGNLVLHLSENSLLTPSQASSIEQLIERAQVLL